MPWKTFYFPNLWVSKLRSFGILSLMYFGRSKTHVLWIVTVKRRVNNYWGFEEKTYRLHLQIRVPGHRDARGSMLYIASNPLKSITLPFSITTKSTCMPNINGMKISNVLITDKFFRNFVTWRRTPKNFYLWDILIEFSTEKAVLLQRFAKDLTNLPKSRVNIQGGSNMTETDLCVNSPGHIWTTLYHHNSESKSTIWLCSCAFWRNVLWWFRKWLPLHHATESFLTS